MISQNEILNPFFPIILLAWVNRNYYILLFPKDYPINTDNNNELFANNINNDDTQYNNNSNLKKNTNINSNIIRDKKVKKKFPKIKENNKVDKQKLKKHIHNEGFEETEMDKKKEDNESSIKIKEFLKIILKTIVLYIQ